MAERDETFLARWSRRKQAAREAGAEPEPARIKPQAPAPARDAAAPDRVHEAPPPDLPDPATLDASSDFSVFLRRDVPLETHRAALRRLWRLDPIYSRPDGLDDYCEDFTDQAKVVKGLRTAYKVGRGLLERTGEAETAADGPAAKSSADNQPAAEPARLAAASGDPKPLPPEPTPQDEPARPTSKRRPRPLPKRG